jgi:hypothetical protein
MTAAALNQLQVGDRIIFRNIGSIHEDLRAGVPVQVLKVIRRARGQVLLVQWGDNEVEIRPGDYFPECFERV